MTVMYDIQCSFFLLLGVTIGFTAAWMIQGDKLKFSETKAKMYKEEAERYLNKMHEWTDELEKKGY